MGAMSCSEVLKVNNPLMGSVAPGIEMAMFREGSTRLTTRAVDFAGRAYTEDGKKVSHHEDEGQRYFTHVLHKDLKTRLSRFKIYHMFSYKNDRGPRIFARFLNCIMLHLEGSGVPTVLHESTIGVLVEIWGCYFPLVLCGLATFRKGIDGKGFDEDSFVITDGLITAIICPHKFEILGDPYELPSQQQFLWYIFKLDLVLCHLGEGNLTSQQCKTNYRDVWDNERARKLGREYAYGPEMTWDRKQNEPRTGTGTGTVEHLGDHRDIPKLAETRKVNWFWLVIPPPETNSSISTVGRREPTFSVEGIT